MNESKLNFKKELKLLNNPLINKPEIYKQIGVGRGHFHDMMNENNGKKFSEEHKKKIKKIFSNLSKQLNGLYTKKKV